MKKYVALARVSSREQEREGFSLDVQEDVLRAYAKRQGGEMGKLYRIAETASKNEQRKVFKELLSHCRANAASIRALLFYKVDRAARNIFDYVELEKLEAEHGVEVIYITQPTENTPAGRMQRRILANMASFYTEQQSLDIRQGMQRRAEQGLFVGHAPYGYRNVRVDGRGLIEVDQREAEVVKRAFELYAYHNHTLDSLALKLREEGRYYTDSHPSFLRSKVHRILLDRSYIGEVPYHGKWYPGRQPPLVGLEVFRRVRAILGNRTCSPRVTLYGSGLIKCAHCGHPIVGEVIRKNTRKGVKEYRYYRCAKYNVADHPRVRLREAQIEERVIAMFQAIRIQDREVQDWIRRVLQKKRGADQKEREARLNALQQRQALIRRRMDQLLNMRLAGEIDSDWFADKSAELREEQGSTGLQIEALSRQQAENADLAIKTFELSQTIEEKWFTSDTPEKRQLLETTCLNFSLEGTNLEITMRKPFDLLLKPPILKDGGGAGS